MQRIVKDAWSSDEETFPAPVYTGGDAWSDEPLSPGTKRTQILAARDKTEQEEQDRGLIRGVPRATEAEMQDEYSQFLEMVAQEKAAANAKKEAARVRKEDDARARKRDFFRKKREAAAQTAALKEAEHRRAIKKAQKIRQEKEAERRRFKGDTPVVKSRIVPQIEISSSEPEVGDEEEEVEVEETDISPELQAKLLAVAQDEDRPILGRRRRRRHPSRRRRSVSRKKQKRKKVTLAEFRENLEQTRMAKVGHSECETLLSFDWKHTWKGNPPDPGRGKGEKIGKGDSYPRLARVADWRRKLTDMWKAPFQLDGYTWQTVQHYIEAAKFPKNPEFQSRFTMESGSDISTFPLMAKYAGGKSGTYRKKRVRPRNIKLSAKKKDLNKALIRATYAKVSQNPHIAILLEDTGDACLFQAKPKKRAVWLEKVRECMRMLQENEWEPPEINS
jgi:predicted NAD-dependent protein-ADP-ribosyltransferase YbiA (DUF1768 family)